MRSCVESKQKKDQTIDCSNKESREGVTATDEAMPRQMGEPEKNPENLKKRREIPKNCKQISNCEKVAMVEIPMEFVPPCSTQNNNLEKKTTERR